jgi:hypothetical protein
LSDEKEYKKQRKDVGVVNSDVTFADVGGNEEYLEVTATYNNNYDKYF